MPLFRTHRTLRTVLFTVTYKSLNFKTVTFRGSVRDIRSLAAKLTTQTLRKNSQHRRLREHLTPMAQATPLELYALLSRSMVKCCANPHSLHLDIRSLCVQTLSPTCTHTHTQRVPTKPTAFSCCLTVTGRSAVSKLCLLVAPAPLVLSTIGYRLLPWLCCT